MSSGAEPQTISWPEPNDERATPGRFCTTFSVSPWVPGTRRASSVRMRVSTASFLMRGARTTIEIPSSSSSFSSTRYFTVRRLPTTTSSSVTTVMSRGCDSSTLYLPAGTSVNPKRPSASVSALTPSSSRILTVTRRIGVFFSRSSTTPSKLICGPAFTIFSRIVNAYL